MSEEYVAAKKENRQPRCIYCGKPLDGIIQHQYMTLVWSWHEKGKVYDTTDDIGDSDAPFCGHCHTPDWEFVDYDWVDY